FMPWMQGIIDPMFGIVLLLSMLGNSIAAVAWSAAISELVPSHISGRFFGKRNLIFGIWTLIIVFSAGWAVGHSKNILDAFVWVFIAAGVARLIGLFFLSRM